MASLITVYFLPRSLLSVLLSIRETVELLQVKMRIQAGGDPEFDEGAYGLFFPPYVTNKN